MNGIGQDRDSITTFGKDSLQAFIASSSLRISKTGQVFSLFENADGSVVFKLDDRYCLAVLDGKLMIQEENEDKESLLNFYLQRKKYS